MVRLTEYLPGADTGKTLGVIPSYSYGLYLLESSHLCSIQGCLLQNIGTGLALVQYWSGC